MGGTIGKIVILIFLGLFTALSLADTTPRKKLAADKLILQIRPNRPAVDVTLNRMAPKPPRPNRPAQIKKPIPWLKIPFFDIGDWYGRGKLFGGDGEGEGDGTGGANTGMGEHDHDHDHGGSSSSSGSGDGDGKPKATGFGYDDNRTKTAAETPAPPPLTPENPPGGNNAPPPAAPPTEVHAKMYPICMLFPPSVEGKANAIAKRFVQMANACQVNIDLHAIPIQEPGDQRDVNAILAGAKATCNAQFGLGVAQASVMVASNDTIAADIMCDQTEPRTPTGCPAGTEDHNNKCYKRNTAGCAQLCRASSITPDQLARLGRQHHGHGGFGDGIIPSIIDAQGHSGETASHEAMAHSQMCWPNGNDAGNGIGVPGEELRYNGNPPESPPGDYTPVGCAQMRANAIPNTAKIGYSPAFNNYYIQGSKRWALGEPYWLPYGDPQPPPPPQPPTAQLASAPPSAPPGGEPPATRPPQGSGKPQDAPPPGGHKKKSGGNTSAVVSIRNGSAGQSDSALNGIPDVPGANGKPGDLSAFGYDENNIKALAADGTTQLVSGGTAPPGGVKGFGYDENNAKAMADGSASSGGTGGPGTSEPGAKEGAAAGEAGGRRPASILGEVKSASAAMDDEFWKKLKLPAKGEDPRPRGSSLRSFDRPLKPLYQGGSVGP